MVDVFITIDAEVWPFSRVWPKVPLAERGGLSREISHYLYGETPVGEFGIRFQSAQLKTFGLKATFFVEALSAEVIGDGELARVIDVIEDGAHETQLHLHPEWLGELAPSELPRRFGQFMHEFSFEEQSAMVARGLANLRRCGARDIVAVRAGNFGADLNTLRAAKANGLRFDSSHNIAYLGNACALSSLGALVRPETVDGVTEVPVSFFSDYPNHLRSAHLCACSFEELKQALLWAWTHAWPSFVIVLHSFELLKAYQRPGHGFAPHPLHLARFTELCRFLADNGDKFRSTHFRDYVPSHDGAHKPLMRSTLRRTLWRYGQQAIGRMA